MHIHIHFNFGKPENKKKKSKFCIIKHSLPSSAKITSKVLHAFSETLA